MVMHLAEWNRLIRDEHLPHMTAGAHLEPLLEVDSTDAQSIKPRRWIFRPSSAKPLKNGEC
ncbi:hypothetical protein KQ939_14490 [Planococcus sp. CP5-4]|uniref:hypothetical protein n=1 Tax=unclassified Planococcus (in: firmicutes) TaxID=2662419 RepID=UPI001C24B99D|nr:MULTISPECIES: hypothetical protein [unclassified Planococcus (in: firmicutes)]MBU9674681.1 hypothetical protein [Planococcus sp. CP5-4_YE]MBV0910422.1 hypothetical protein [Planococcus sp. CP5-4_UN]MBW6064889.1 hypothetical protein [Planococcus sp. CP5-4]